MQKKIRRGSLKWSAEGADIERPKASRALGIGRGCPPPRRLASLASVVISPAGSGVEPRPQTPFRHFLSVNERFSEKMQYLQ